MTENLNIALHTDQGDAAFILTFDPAYAPDLNMRLALERDRACEPEVVHLMMRVLKAGDVVIDGGANVGFFTCLMSALVGPTGKVFAVEPTPYNVTKIKGNLGNNNMKNVTIISKALYHNSEETVFLHMGLDSGYNSLTQHAASTGKLKVKTITIDDSLDGYAPRLIKLDIEGAELAALSGAQQALSCKPYVVVELQDEALNRMGTSIREVRHFMRHLGFELFLLQLDGTLPRLVPADSVLKSQKQNLMGLFATIEMVGAAWPEVQAG